jgi:hypothetical protein
METALSIINTLWPIITGFSILIFWLAKSYADVETLKEKVRTLFELFNEKMKGKE